MQKTEISPGIILSSLENHSLTLQQKAEIIDWAETNCYVFNQKDMFNPFEFIPDKFDDCEEEYIIGVMARPEYFWGICYHFFGVTLAPMQCEILYRMWTHKAVMVIGCRGMSKTWMLAVYCLLRAYILKGRKIVIAASGFRQSKLVVNYIEEIRSKSPFLKMLIPDDAISHGNDLWEIKIGTSSIKAIPLGATGNTVRGLRASEVIAEEFSCLERSTLIKTSKGLVRISDYINGRIVDLVNKDGNLECPEKVFVTPPTDVYEVTTQNGYSFKCSSIHQVMTTKGWKLAKDLTPDDYLELKFDDYFPSELYIDENNNTFDKKEAMELASNIDDYECLPTCILQSPKSVVSYFFFVLFNEIPGISYSYVKHRQTALDIQVLLLNYGIVSTLALKDEKYYIEIDHDNRDEQSAMQVMSVTLLPEPDSLYDFYLPETHSFLGNGFIQHNSMPVEIFQTVIQGFSSVNASPYAAAAFRAKQNIASRLGVASIVADEQSSNIDNQLIISGTAYYTWNHFYKYHEEYKSIIKSRGDKEKLLKIFNGEIPKGFNYKDYCIIRMPIELLPENFMDEGAIGRAKLTTDSATYANEYGAVFSNDSKGFFKRSCIDSSIPVEGQEYYLSNGHTIPAEDAYFEPLVFGKRDKTYVMGVDPAIKDDNFSIVIIELNDFYRKIVYCWTIDGMTHKEKIKQGVTRENNYYAYCARKIRDLCQKFNVVAIALDPLGGGEAVREALTDLDKLEPHERMILPIIDPEKPMDSDSLVGDHIIHLCKTSNTTWIYDANHELRKDIEDKSILFPPFDVVTVADAEFIEETKRIENKIDDNDSKSAILYEVEELKDELSLITVTETASGIQHFDTPETVAKGGKKSRMKKDRYSALLMANKIARDFFPYSSVAKMSRFDIYNSKIKSGEKSTGYLGNQDLANKLSNIHSFI